MKGPGLDAIDSTTLAAKIGDASHDLIYVYDTQNRLRLWNRRVTDLLGYTDTELTNKDPTDFVSEEQEAQVRAALERTHADGTAEFELDVITATGETIPIEFRTGLLTDVSGEPVGRFGIGRDITSRRQQKQETERRATALTASIDGMSILDQSGEYVFVNQAHADVYGYASPDAFLGNSWRMCYDDETVAEFEAEVLPILEETGAWRGEATGLRQDGTTFPQDLSLSTMADGGMVCVVHDITDVREREAELRAQKRRLDEFSTIVSHDLRGPLNVAQGHLEYVRATGDVEIHLPPAERALDKMEALIRDILALARDGTLVEAVEPVSLIACVTEARATVAPELADIEVADVVVHADRARLVQVFENLLRNVTDHAGPETAVRVGLLSESDGFFVEDDGPGIPAADHDTIFEPGYTTAPSGTGFGLSIVAQIVEGHDWQIRSVETDSAGDGGTRFEITGVKVLPE